MLLESEEHIEVTDEISIGVDKENSESEINANTNLVAVVSNTDVTETFVSENTSERETAIEDDLDETVTDIIVGESTIESEVERSFLEESGTNVKEDTAELEISAQSDTVVEPDPTGSGEVAEERNALQIDLGPFFEISRNSNDSVVVAVKEDAAPLVEELFSRAENPMSSKT